jgi:hypothetical protein
MIVIAATTSPIMGELINNDITAPMSRKYSRFIVVPFEVCVCSPKWVYRDKNWPRKKFGWSTYVFRVVICYP